MLRLASIGFVWMVGCGASSSTDASLATKCESYCTVVESSCTGALDQYGSRAACLATCAHLPLGVADEQFGNSIGCRTYHGGVARNDPSTHCAHAGPGGDGTCGENCEAFCAIVQGACQGDQAVYPDNAACLSACASFDDSATYELGALGDTLACRLFHATLAAVDPVAECVNAAAISASCR